MTHCFYLWRQHCSLKQAGDQHADLPAQRVHALEPCLRLTLLSLKRRGGSAGAVKACPLGNSPSFSVESLTHAGSLATLSKMQKLQHLNVLLLVQLLTHARPMPESYLTHA